MASGKSTETETSAGVGTGYSTFSGTYTLYYFPFSLYSLMAKFAYVLGQSTVGGNTNPCPLLFNVKLLNLHTNEQVSKEYLENINIKGEVPALVGGALPAPLADSMDIIFWLCKVFPALLPAEHEGTIRKLMYQQRDINAFSLVVKDKELLGKPFPLTLVEDLVTDPSISPEYRQLLEGKLRIHDSSQANALLAENVQLAVNRARDFLLEVEKLLVKYSDDNSPWIFGSNAGPTALDARTVPFTVRLLDVDRQDLVPQRVQEYARTAKASPQWHDVTYGRSTMWNVSYRHVNDFPEFNDDP